MVGITIIAIIWAILSITTGNDPGFGWILIGFMVFSVVSTVFVLKYWTNDDENGKK